MYKPLHTKLQMLQHELHIKRDELMRSNSGTRRIALVWDLTTSHEWRQRRWITPKGQYLVVICDTDILYRR
jgi:hypothetical protein